MAAVRVSFTSVSASRKTLTPNRKPRPPKAQPKREFLSAGKKLSDTSTWAYGGVTMVRGKVVAHWHERNPCLSRARSPARKAHNDRGL